MKRIWLDYPDIKPTIPYGKTAIDVIVRTAENKPYPMHFRKSDNKFVASDAVIIQWRYKESEQ